MAKTFLKISEEIKFDFSLIGLICHHRDYRLSMTLNTMLDIHLGKKDDYVVYNNKRMEDQHFSFYEFIDTEGNQYNLIGNKSIKGHLVPEQKQLDYLLLLKSPAGLIDDVEVLAKLKTIPMVLAAYRFETSTLRSRENLVF